jgi:DNA-binding MltR family transcriptional regulator
MAARQVPQPLELSVEAIGLARLIASENPRACALIGVSFLENALASILLAFFVDTEESKSLLDVSTGILGPFVARANMAYCLGLISKPVLENLKRLAKIRNEFAHSYRPVDFTTAPVPDLCRTLTTPIIVWEDFLPLKGLIGLLDWATCQRVINLNSSQCQP